MHEVMAWMNQRDENENRAPTKTPAEEFAVHVDAGETAGAMAGGMLSRANVDARRAGIAFGAHIRPFTLELGPALGWIGQVLVLPGVANTAPTGMTALRLCGMRRREGGERRDDHAIALDGAVVPTQWLLEGSAQAGQRIAQALCAGELATERVSTQGTQRIANGTGFEQWHEAGPSRRMWETACATLGRGHPRCAGLWAARRAIEAATQELGGNAATVLTKGHRAWALRNAIRKDWTPTWRRWLASMSDPESLRIVAALGSGAPRLDNSGIAAGLAIVRLNDGGEKARARRTAFAKRHPLWTTLWLFGCANADNAIANAEDDRKVFRHIVNRLGMTSTPARVGRARRLGRGQSTARLAFANTKRASAPQARMLIATGVDCESTRAPRTRRAWRALDAVHGLASRRFWEATEHERMAILRAGLDIAETLVQGQTDTTHDAVHLINELRKERDRTVSSISRLGYQAVLNACTGEDGKPRVGVDEAHAMHRRIQRIEEAAGNPAKTLRLVRRANGISAHAALTGARIRADAGDGARWTTPRGPIGTHSLTTLAECAREGLAERHCLATNAAGEMLDTGPENETDKPTRQYLLHAYRIDRTPEHAGMTIVVKENADGRVRLTDSAEHRGTTPANSTPTLEYRAGRAAKVAIGDAIKTERSEGESFEDAIDVRKRAAQIVQPVEQWATATANAMVWRGFSKLLAPMRGTPTPEAFAAAVLKEAQRKRELEERE